MRILYGAKMLFLKIFPQFMKSKDYIEWLEYMGVSVGKGTFFFSPKTTIVDIQRPWMLHIGEFCKITGGCVILCHDYSRSVLRRVYGEIIGEARPTYIGNNVFVGINSIILMGSHIGNNVIIGAGSVVSGSIPDNVVIAGNPAKVICSLDEYYQKRKEKSIDEAKTYFSFFKNHYNRIPTVAEMGPFFWQFLERNEMALKENEIFTDLSGDDERDIISSFLASESIYKGYSIFIEEASKREKETN